MKDNPGRRRSRWWADAGLTSFCELRLAADHAQGPSRGQTGMIWQNSRHEEWKEAWASKAGGRGVAAPVVEKSAGDVPPEIMCDISVSFFFPHIPTNFAFINIFKIKWPKSEERLNFLGRCAFGAPNPSPNQNFVATWASKAGGRGTCLLVEKSVGTSPPGNR